MAAPEIVVAGHICVDIIPAFGATYVPLEALLRPGRLTNVGPALLSTGGAVSNTGIALHRLGAAVRLMGKVGPDLFGSAILDIVRGYDPALAEGMIVDPAADSSYTLVINPPGIDRIFLHCPGANDTFGAADVPLDKVRDARIFHFGYPPLMRRMYLHEGSETVALLRAVRDLGVATSLDMAQPDPDAEAGRVDWLRLLQNVLPAVDIFTPSLAEMLYMLDRPRFDALHADHRRPIDSGLLRAISDRLLAMGAAIVALKLGDQGLYLRTTGDADRLAALTTLALDLPAWRGRELLAPCFRVAVAGTTGAGDCTTAGLLTALLHGLDASQTLIMAVGVGGCSVESPDATGGVPAWDAVQTRIAAGWAHHPLAVHLDGWRNDGGPVWFGPDDPAR
jgi:sugar/nucleoside kinase (ribokinase family)